MHASRLIARRMREMASELPMMTDFWNPDVTLVPVPRSGLQRAGSLWPSLLIATGLADEGFGGTAVPMLERATAIQKAAWAARGSRPCYVENMASSRVNLALTPPAKETLVDDVMTKGVALLSAAHALATAYPNTQIRGFAAVRTMGLQSDVDALLDPCVGTIRMEILKISSEVRDGL